MSATATQTAQVNGEPSYESKFLPKVNAIPVVNSLREHIFTHVPQAENLSKHVGRHLGTVFTYTKDTPVQPMLIKLDTLAANGVAKLEKEVPLVASPTEEVLKKTKIDKVLEFVTKYYVMYVNYVLSIFKTYEGVLDRTVTNVLSFAEQILGIQPTPEESQSSRFTKIKETFVAKVDEKVTSLITQVNEVATSVYNQIFRVLQSPLKFFNAEKDKAAETYSPVASEVKARFSKAESATKRAWLENKPDISGPNAFVPFIKAVIFTTIVFGYNILYPESKKSEPKKGGVEDQTNGLVSGIERSDGDATKRPNGSAS